MKTIFPKLIAPPRRTKVLLLFATAAILASATNLRTHMPTETAPNPMAKPSATAVVACSIDSMEVAYQDPCKTNGTEPEWTDDYSLTNLEVYHTGAKVGDVIEVVHSHLIEQSPQWAVVDATEAANGKSYLWAIKMRCDINVNAPVPGDVPIGTFTILLKDGTTGDTLCTASFNPPKNHVKPCSVCTANEGNWDAARPNCWPNETPPDACSDPLNHAPDPDHLEHTPLRYVKVMIHIFQVAPPMTPTCPTMAPSISPANTSTSSNLG